MSVTALSLGLCIVSFPHAGDEERLGDNDVLLYPITVRYSSLVGQDFTALFAHMTADRLRELKEHREASVAIRAAWEECRRTLLAAKQTDPSGESRLALERLLRFVEGRLQVALPKPWEESMRSVHVSAYRHVGFRNTKTPPTFSDELGGWLWPNVTVKIGEPCEFAIGPARALVDRAIVDKLRDHGENIWRAFVHNDTCYLVVYSEMGSGPDLVRVNPSTAEALWSSSVWGTGWVVWGGRGEPGYNIELLEDRGTVYLFGSGAAGGIIEGYDAKSGAAVLRFATTDWQQPDRKTAEADEKAEAWREANGSDVPPKK